VLSTLVPPRMDAVSAEGLNGFKVAELKAFCAARNLSVKVRQATLTVVTIVCMLWRVAKLWQHQV
jgi:hypothetical protein